MRALVATLALTPACGAPTGVLPPQSASNPPPEATPEEMIALPAAPPPAAASAAPQAPVAPAAPAASEAPASAPAPIAALFTADTSSIQRLFEDASRAPTATLQAKGALGDDPLAKGVRDVAKRAAAGMQPDGPLAMGVLKEKQVLQTDVTLEPGKCYAIVGYSKKLGNVDLYLLLSPGILSAQDNTDDNTPVIGGSAQPLCPAAATPITYKLAIIGGRGAGDVAVQLYSKGK
jgi:hypothetical protein